MLPVLPSSSISSTVCGRLKNSSFNQNLLSVASNALSKVCLWFRFLLLTQAAVYSTRPHTRLQQCFEAFRALVRLGIVPTSDTLAAAIRLWDRPQEELLHFLRREMNVRFPVVIHHRYISDQTCAKFCREVYDHQNGASSV